MVFGKFGQTSLEFILLFAVAVSLVLLIGIVTFSAAKSADIENVPDRVAEAIGNAQKDEPNGLKHVR